MSSPRDLAPSPGDAGIWPAVVVGAGAAGLLAALFAARGGVRLLLLETRARAGAKIRLSGGGRCNVLPSAASLDDFHTGGSRHTLRNILFSWPLEDVRRFFESDLGIPLKVEPTGKVFPQSERPQDIVQALLGGCERAGVVRRGSSRIVRVRRLEPDAAGARFELTGAGGERYASRRLVLATGGLSLPKTGSDGGGLAMAHALGLQVQPTYPVLVPLRSADRRWTSLAGVAVRARLGACRGSRVLEEREGDLLCTHRGFSGPVVLDMSRHLSAPGSDGVSLRVCWGGGAGSDWDARLRQGGKQTVAALLRARLPRRLADLLARLAAVPPERRAGELTRHERGRLVEVLGSYLLPVGGNEGYGTAEATAGGVALADLVGSTLESRRIPGLYCAGEMLDVVGRIGGYNFLWAWVTGRKVGQALAAACHPTPRTSATRRTI